jgi:hypothetical protein
MNNFIIYTYPPQNIYTWLYKGKKFGHVSVNDLNLHRIYISYIQAIDTYMHKTNI